MIVKSGEISLDLDTIHGPSDLLAFIDSIECKTPNVLDRAKSRAKKAEILFDECTSKENVLRNMITELEKQYRIKRAKLFPEEAAQLYRLKERNVGEITLPAVGYEEYMDMQRMAYCREFMQSYVSFLIQGRVGFGLHARVDTEGRIYVLEDLRELHALG